MNLICRACRRPLILFLPCFFFFNLLCTRGFSQTMTPVYNTSPGTSNSNGYYVYLPAGYNQSSASFPLMFFIHGVGELGSGNSTDLPAVLRNGPPRLIAAGTFPSSFTVNGKTSTFIIMCPQFINIPQAPDLNACLAWTIQHYRVDISRIYFTGLSMGGGNIWNWAGFTDNAKQLAALLPVCGAYQDSPQQCQVIASDNLPVYATHNEDDPTVPSSYTINNVNMINSSNPPPNPLAVDTIFPNVASHDAWTTTYDPNFRNPRVGNLNVYEWMLQFRLGGTILPVTYTDFEVHTSTVNDNTRVTVDWTTASEQNNHYFVIQRSTDGVLFTSLDSLPATNLTTAHSYSYIDGTPPSGHDFYRIQQVDLDGKTSFTGIKEVTVGSEGPLALRISPNPASGATVFLEMNSAGLGVLQVSLSDAQGKIVHTWTFQKQNAQWSQTLDLGNVPPGNYFITVKGDNNSRQVRQLTKL
jgi:dienelactone hydrolase